MTRARFVLRLVVTLAFASLLCAIWVPNFRWQFLATSVVMTLAAGMIGVGLDAIKKEQGATTNVVNINNAKGNGDRDV